MALSAGFHLIIIASGGLSRVRGRSPAPLFLGVLIHISEFCLYLHLIHATSRRRSADQRGTGGFNGIDLGQVDGRAAESSGQLVAVEVLALGGGDGAQGVAGRLAHAAGLGPAQRTMLLGVLAVGGEGGRLGGLEVGWELVGWGRRVGVRGVVDGGWRDGWLER